VKYARSGDVAIAYQVVGTGALDFVFIRGTIADLMAGWDQPLFVTHVDGLAESGRVLLFDKRGSGLSDPVRQVPTLETRMDDVRAVMDAAGSERAVLWAAQEGSRIALLFAATYPERTTPSAHWDWRSAPGSTRESASVWTESSVVLPSRRERGSQGSRMLERFSSHKRSRTPSPVPAFGSTIAAATS